jgi:hypothetical protein
MKRVKKNNIIMWSSAKTFKSHKWACNKKHCKEVLSLIDGSPISRPSTPSYSSLEPRSHASNPSASLNFKPFASMLNSDLFKIE